MTAFNTPKKREASEKFYILEILFSLELSFFLIM